MELKDAIEILERFKEIIPNTIGKAIETLLQSLENKDKEIAQLKENNEYEHYSVIKINKKKGE